MTVQPNQPPNPESEKLMTDSWVRGKVVDNDDPKKAGRVKIRVKPLHGNIPTSDLPWAIPARGQLTGGDADGTYGQAVIPKEGSWVFITHEAGDPRQILYHLDAPTKDSIPDHFTGNTSTKDTIDSNAVSGDLVKEKSGESTSYPDSKGMKFESGIILEVGDDPDNPRLLIFHDSGARYEILSSGDVVQHSEEDLQQIAAKALDLYGGNKVNIDSGGDTEVDTDGNTDINSTGPLTADANQAKIKMEGGIIKLNPSV